MTETTVLDQQKSRSDLTLQVSRVIHAERSRVYQAWTRPELIAQWFAPGKTISNITADPRPGGEYRFEFFGLPCEADVHAPQVPSAVNVTGVYKDVVPDERISYTWQGSNFPDEHTLVTVEFKDAPGGTEVTITHENFASAEVMNQHNRGWEGCLTSLENFLKK
jgi:uncharacterized protein YndB with AHSA1/START domain